ncbi:MAG: type II secretion system GspH family protein [Acidobacteria bacterium]|nr:type II secretion system GspH family protein [Acidobacteriota bacterium]
MNINKNQRNTNKRTDPGKRTERGYALIGLMAVMMFALILTTAAAPTLRQEMQREKEEEMLWRGQQVALGIKRYRQARGGMFPTDLNDLIKVTEVNGKRLRFMRPSALCDPMMPCTGENNWRLVHPGDPLPAELLTAISETQEKSQTTINPQGIQELARFALLGAANANLPGRPADTQLDGNIGPVENQGGDSGSTSNEQKAPIIGVVSRKSDKMFRSYFGIDQYDHALFFQDIPVVAGGFVNPFVLGATIAGGGAGPRDPRCPPGGVFINGQCYGNVLPGKMCRQTDGSVAPCPPALKR